MSHWRTGRKRDAAHLDCRRSPQSQDEEPGLRGGEGQPFEHGTRADGSCPELPSVLLKAEIMRMITPVLESSGESQLNLRQKGPR